jgi:hypothetical protein
MTSLTKPVFVVGMKKTHVGDPREAMTIDDQH